MSKAKFAPIPARKHLGDHRWAVAGVVMMVVMFVLVVVFTLIQAPTLPWVARRLGLGEGHHQVALAVDATPLEELGADRMVYQEVEDLKAAIIEGSDLTDLDMCCFDGRYVTGTVTDEYLDWVEGTRVS